MQSWDEEWWYDMAFAYTHGLIEPEPGTAEDEAFREFDEYNRREVERVAEQNKRDLEYARQKAAREAELDTCQPDHAPQTRGRAGSRAVSTHRPRGDPESPDPDGWVRDQPAPDPAPERLAYSVDEAARLTGLSRDLLYDQMRRGNLSYVKVGRRRLITRQHLHQFLRAAS
jgi:excisionase family DNA binding protein